MTTDNQALIEQLNQAAPGIIKSLGGKVLEIDLEQGSCLFEYNIGEELCHSVDTVQGGIITAMLDAAMSHATFGTMPGVVGLASLEIKVSFLEPSKAGRFTCRGWIRRAGYKVAFLEGELYNKQGAITATASTTAKLNRA